MAAIGIELVASKEGKKGFPLRIYVTHKGTRTYFTTSERIPAEGWDKKAQQVTSKVPGYREINRNIAQKINALEAIIRDLIYEYAGREESFTISDIKERYDKIMRPGEAVDRSDIFELIESFKASKKNVTSERRLKKYDGLASRLREYEIYAGVKLTLNSFDANFGDNFRDFLLHHAKVTNRAKGSVGVFNNTVWSHFRCLSAVLNYLIRYRPDVRVRPDFKNYGVKQQRKEIIYLTEAELLRLYALDFENEYFNIAKDLFCFSCWTGLRYSDVQQVNKSCVKNDAIDLTMFKTKRGVIVPLNQYSRAILEKYNYAMPQMTNQEVNKHLKIVALKAGFHSAEKRVRFKGTERVELEAEKWELLTFHAARATFAILLLLKGVTVPEVMEMGGWDKYETFKSYIKIADTATKASMLKAWG